MAERRSGGTERPVGTTKKNQVDEYVESYRVLREHGNAFMIIVFEILLAALLSWVHSNDCECVVICLLLWVSLGAIAWVIATCLEFHIPKVMKPQENAQISLSVTGQFQKIKID